MNRQPPAFDQRIADWLELDPSTAPPEVLKTVLAALPSISQARRGRLAPWRFTNMTSSMRAAAAVAIVAIVGVGVLAFNLGVPGTGDGAPSATAATSPSIGPSVSAMPSSATVSFTSPLYGYTVSVPAGWATAPATLPWPEGTTCCLDAYRDSFEAPRSQYPEFDGVLIATQPVPEGTSSDAWLLQHSQQQAASGRDCKGLVDDWTDAVVGTLEIRRVDLECEGIRLSDVAFVVDRTGYVMSGNRDAIALFLETFEAGS